MKHGAVENLKRVEPAHCAPLQKGAMNFGTLRALLYQLLGISLCVVELWKSCQPTQGLCFWGFSPRDDHNAINKCRTRTDSGRSGTFHSQFCAFCVLFLASVLDRGQFYSACGATPGNDFLGVQFYQFYLMASFLTYRLNQLFSSL